MDAAIQVKLPPAHRSIFIWMARCASDKDGVTSISQDKLAIASGNCSRTVRRIVKDLAAAELIEFVGFLPHGLKQYKINVEDSPKYGSNEKYINMPIFSESEAANFLGVSIEQMVEMRNDGSGPKMIPYNNGRYYHRHQLNRWLISNQSRPQVS